MKPVFALSGGAVLVTAMIGLTLWSVRPSDGTGTESGPELAADPPFLIIDSEQADSRVATVMIKNVSHHRIRLLKISSSCGCTVADPPESERLEPGESTKLRIRGTPPSAGQKNSFVQIESDSASTRWLRINLQLKGKQWPVPRIVRAPDEIVLQNRHYAIERISTSFQVHTVEREGSEYWLKERLHAPEKLSIDLESLVESPGSEPQLVSRTYKYTISGTVDPQEPWEDKISLNLSTESIPIRVVAEYAPPFKLVPNTLFLDLSSREVSTTKRNVLIVGSEGAETPEFSIEPPPDPCIQVRIQGRAASDSTVLARLEVSLSSLPDMATSRSTIRIRTNHLDCPTLELPIVIKTRRNETPVLQ